MGFWKSFFGGKADIRAHFSQFLQELRETPRAEGCPRVWIHGEKELESEARRRREGAAEESQGKEEGKDLFCHLSNF